jgi:hypothetical protein
LIGCCAYKYVINIDIIVFWFSDVELEVSLEVGSIVSIDGYGVDLLLILLAACDNLVMLQ